MATSGSSNDTRNFQCVTVASVDVIKLPLSDILASHIKPVDLYHKIKSCSTLKLRPDQQKICFIPPPGVPDYNKFDVTLLYRLIRNLCSIPCPAQGWGNEPRTKDTQISDDIERLRLFRNNYYAHAESAVISDAVFKDVWRDLKLVFRRIQPKTGCSVHYEEELINIERTKFTDDYLTTFRIILEAYAKLEKQTDDEPDIFIQGENEILCGGTARFEADVKNVESSCWSIAWQKRRVDIIKRIDTNMGRYNGSTKKTLVINSVSKEDEGEYQAILSFKSNGPEYKSRNTIFMHVIKAIPFLNISGVTSGSEGITIHYNCGVSDQPPKVYSIEWSKNGQKLDYNNKKYVGGGVHDSCFKITSPTYEDRGDYSCKVTNAVGTVAKNIMFGVPHVEIFVDSPVFFGSHTAIKSVISSTPTPGKIEWQKSKDGIDFQIIEKEESFERSVISTCPFLMIHNATFVDKLYYRLLVWNGIGEGVSNTVYLNVTGSPPYIETISETNIKNRSVKLTGNVIIYDDSPGMQDFFWTRNDKTIDFKESNGKLSETRTDNPSLTITNVGPDDAGEYRLTAINAVGSYTSDAVVLDIPRVIKENTEDETNGGQWITVAIKSIPAPCRVQWSFKRKDDDSFTPVDINAEEYKGTTVSLPHPALFLRQKDLQEQICFRIEVTNFIGKTIRNISSDDNPEVLKKTDIVENTLYHDLGASLRFTKLYNILANQFPPTKLEQLKQLLIATNKVKHRKAVLEAKSALDCLRILQDESLFTQTDVIFMQFLCRETDCLDLNEKCIEYAEKQKALCFYERTQDTGFRIVQFHVRGNLSSYTKNNIRMIRETVAVMVGCKAEDILLNGIRPSTSFLLCLSVKEVYSWKLLDLIEQHRLKLMKLDIDYFIINKDTILLEGPTELKKEGSSWHQHISSTLEKLAASIADSFTKLSSDSSFANKLLNEVNQSEFVNVIQSLSRGIELFTKINTDKCTNQPGKVYVVNIKVRCKGNHIVLVKEDAENWNKFLHADSEHLLKVIIVQSRSVRVIEAKLQVYKKFKNDINAKNIFLQHVLEDYDEIAKRSAHMKISSFCNIIDLLIKSLNLCKLCTIITKAFNQVLTQNTFKNMCDNIFVEYIGEKTGTVDSSSLLCDSTNPAEGMKGLLKGKIISTITDGLSSFICSEIANHFRLQFEIAQKVTVQRFDELPVSIRYLIDSAVKTKMSIFGDESLEYVELSEEFLDETDWTPSTSLSGIAYAFSHSLDDSAICSDVNSRYWREEVANELFFRMRIRSKHIIFGIGSTIGEIFETTKTELQLVYERLCKCQSGLQLVDQKGLVEIWKKRKIIKNKQLAKHPSILNYIAGTKYGRPFVKVFMRQKDLDGEQFIRQHSTLSEDTYYDFVNVSAKSTNRKEMEKMKGNKKEAPVLPDDIRNILNKIINSQAEKIYANHTTVSGLGVSNVKHEEDNFIEGPCIVVYCLDKDLIPYGETLLPTSVKGCPCDIREGVFMFGYCADCRNVSPNPGCSIGMPNDIYTGSAGFIVKSTSPKYLTGFLTAAHVSIEESLDLYEEGLLLSKCSCDFAERKHEIIHPSWSNIKQNNVIGEVKESFIGNFDGEDEFQDKFGIDAAFVQSYQKRLGEINEMQIAADHTLTFDGKTRVTKKGQSTGLTYGLLKSNSLSINICFSRFPGRLFSFNNCYEVKDEDTENPFFKEGDSGSGVFVTENDKHQKALGIAFAYQTDGDITVVCKIQPIIEACNLTICQEELDMES